MATKYLKGECSHCRGHIEFPVESTGLTAECPHCGQTTELLLIPPGNEPAIPSRVIMWTGVAVLILGCGLALALVALKRAESWAERQRAAARQVEAAPQPEPLATNTAPEPEDPTAKAGFQISEIRIEKTKGSSLIYAVGNLTNTEARTRYGVKLQLDLFDEADKKVGTASDTQATMELNTQWQFHALVLDKKAMKAKVAAVTEQQ